MKAVLDRLGDWIERNRPEFEKELRLGATSEAIERAQEAIGCQFPQAFGELYKWHDGQMRARDGVSVGIPDFYDGHRFMSLEDVVSDWADMTEDLVDINDYKDWWNPGWVPFLASAYDPCRICLDLVGSFDGVVGQVLRFHFDDESRPILFPSVEAWLECYLESLDKGIWDTNGGTVELIDHAGWDTLVNRRCPGFPRDAEATID